MRIAFDAKRAFQNRTGLGHYSRTLISSLAKEFPSNEYYLMTPKVTSLYQYDGLNNIHPVAPGGLKSFFKSAWRSKWVTGDLKKLDIDIYHGLSHEIPVGLSRTGVKSVATIHDLIFERYSAQYQSVDVAIYRKKCKHACAYADRIIAISEQTKQDIISYYGTPESKISVCYQSCNPIFQGIVTDEEKLAVKKKYKLPERFFLYVGSIIERKNLLTICKAMAEMKTNDIPLVVIGNGGGKYEEKVKSFVRKNALTDKVIFLSEDPAFMENEHNSADFPAIYQQATAMIYPSIFEGFGLPVLEALWSRLPVITTNSSCLPETGGDAAYYVSPYAVNEMTEAMQKIAGDEQLRRSMIEKGLAHAQKFTPERCASAVMDVYQSVVQSM